MKSELIVKDNALINASYNLEMTEQRLILLAIVNARKTGQGITADSKLEIRANDYATHFNVTNEAAYIALKAAVNNLFERQFSFKEAHKDTGKIGIVRSRWVSRIKYVDELAVLEVTFSPDVVPLITRLEKNFTSYQLEQVAGLTSKYAIRLYELLISWRAVGKCYYELGQLRDALGIGENEYAQMGHFKSRVLDVSLKQIKDHTDIEASYTQKKRGRVIIGFDFKFTVKQKAKPKDKDKTERDQNTIDLFSKMTDKQIATFSRKLAELPALGGNAPIGASAEQYADIIAKDLANPLKWEFYKPFLLQVGFKA